MSELPEGWEVKTFGELSEKIGSGVTPQGGSKSYKKTGIPLIRSQNVLWGKLDLSDVAYIDELQHEKMKGSIVKKNDTLLNITGASIGRVAISNLDEANVNQHVCIIRPRNNLFSSYLKYFLLSYEGQKQIEQCQAGGNRQGLNFEQIKSFKIPLPPLPEQRKIAEILSTWDKAIATTEKQIANSKQQKKALMQQLLTGKKRLAGFSGDWDVVSISDLIVESRIKGTNGETAKKITVKLYGLGVAEKEEKRSGSPSTKYYKRKSGQFIYSKLDFLNGAFGIIPSHLNGYESTLDLPAFDFTNKVVPEWFIDFVSRDSFYTANLALANGGRKARRVNPKDLLNIKIKLPPLPEQRKIAQVLTTADKEISALETQLSHLQQEKKALMQQLLTGKRRVVVAES